MISPPQILSGYRLFASRSFRDDGWVMLSQAIHDRIKRAELSDRSLGEGSHLAVVCCINRVRPSLPAQGAYAIGRLVGVSLGEACDRNISPRLG